MRIIFEYLYYYFGIKFGFVNIKQKKIANFIRNKHTIGILGKVLIKYWFPAIKNIPIMIKYRDFYTTHTSVKNENDFIKQIDYYRKINKKIKIIVMPSYCEKPLNCPDRYKIYCKGMKSKCNIDCKFRNYYGFSNGKVEYRFMTDDTSVANVLVYSLKYSIKYKTRVFLIMSVCNFSVQFVRFFGIFNVSIIVYTFTNKFGQCTNILQYFSGDAGMTRIQNSIDKSSFENMNNLVRAVN